MFPAVVYLRHSLSSSSYIILLPSDGDSHMLPLVLRYVPNSGMSASAGRERMRLLHMRLHSFCSPRDVQHILLNGLFLRLRLILLLIRSECYATSLSNLQGWGAWEHTYVPDPHSIHQSIHRAGKLRIPAHPVHYVTRTFNTCTVELPGDVRAATRSYSALRSSMFT